MIKHKSFLIIYMAAAVSLGTAGCGRIMDAAKSSVNEIVVNLQDANALFVENTIQEETVSSNYYYQQLSEEDRVVYKEILQGLQEYSENIYVHSNDTEQIERAYRSILYDCPELFWCTGDGQTAVYTTYAQFSPGYAYGAEETERRKQEIEQAVQACLSQVPGELSEYERIKFIYDYIVNTTDYNLGAVDNQNICSVFLTHSSVCAGYAKAMQYLLQRLGTECIYVTGVTSDGEAHAWNIVKCDGEYYQVDVTWGDPVFLLNEGEEMPPDLMINYDYLCSSDSEIFRTHTPSDEVQFPACTSMNYNYYILNGMYYDHYNRDVVLNAMNQSIYAGQSHTIFKFSDAAVYEEASNAILNELVGIAAQNLAVQYGLSEVEYSYIQDGDTNKLIILWNYQ